MIPGVTVPTWPAVGSIAAGVGTAALLWWLARHRGKPGANWFLAVLVAQATWCFSYGFSLLVFDETLRRILEMITWFGITWTGITFLAFALEYTGRGHLIRSKLYGAFVSVGVVTTALALTNPLFGLLYTDFRIDPVYGAATVSYTFQPWAYFTVAVATVAVASGVFLLVDTLVSYGPLYRREAAAVSLSALPPGFALVAWVLEIGPVPQLNLAPIMFIPHVLLDAYAFGRAEMFERDPTAIRAAERTAIDDLTDPIVIVDVEGRVVRLNEAARSAFQIDDALARHVTEVLDVPALRRLDMGPDVSSDMGPDVSSDVGPDVSPDGGSDGGSNAESTDSDARDPHDVTSADGRQTFAVSISALSDPGDTTVGFTIVFSDVTERERRRQQLEVLNRVLRHNLRNDVGVVHGYAELLEEQLTDDGHVRMADAIERRSGALLALGEKAGTVETLLEGEESASVSLASVTKGVVDRHRESFPDANVAIDVREDTTATYPERTLTAAIDNLVENALRHHDDEGSERDDAAPWVRVTVDRENGQAIVRIADDGPGVPEHELAAIEAGRETALEHGSGLGLWIVHWAATAMGAETAYADREPRGTVATLRLPVSGVAGKDGADDES